MIEQLRQLIDNSHGLNNYLRLLKKDGALYDWVNSQLPAVRNINEKIYILLNGYGDKCVNGNIKTFLDYKRGYGYCGRADKCKCLLDISANTNVWQLNKAKLIAASNKRKLTNIEKYGVDNPSKSDIIKHRKISTSQTNWGTDNPMQSAMVSDRLKITCIDRYGVDNPAKSPEVRQKMVETSLDRYGVRNYSQTEQFKLSFKKSVVDSHPLRSVMYDYDEMHSLYGNKTPLEISDILGYSNSSNVVQFLKDTGQPYKKGNIYSKWQGEVAEYIRENYTGAIIEGDRKMLHGKEIDILLPDLNLAIECNGSFWHSELNGKDRLYHLNKTKKCNELGINLIHIWEHQWNRYRDIVRSRLKSRLGKNTTIYARRCTIKVLTSAEISDFFDKTHLQGSLPATTYLGLFCGDELVSGMSFVTPRYSKHATHELLRFSSILGHTVVGAASKLLTYFIKNYTTIGDTIITYSDTGWNTGNVYTTIGFVFSHESAPSYYYTKRHTEFHHRSAFQKHKLASMLDVYDINLTEWQNMKNNGYDRIWDCGTSVYLLTV